MTASSLPAEFASLPFYDVQPNSILRFDTAVDVLLRFDLPPSDPSLDSTFYLEPFSTGGNYSNGGVLLKSIGHPTQTFTNQASASFFDSDFNDISSYLYFHGFDQDLNGGVYYARYTSSVPSDLLVFDEKTNMADASIWNDFLLNVVSPVESSFDDFVFSYADSTKN